MTAWMLALALTASPSGQYVDVDLIEVNQLMSIVAEREANGMFYRAVAGPKFYNFRDFYVWNGVGRYWVRDYACGANVQRIEDIDGRPIVIVKVRRGFMAIRGRAIEYTYGHDTEVADRNEYPEHKMARIIGLRDGYSPEPFILSP